MRELRCLLVVLIALGAPLAGCVSADAEGTGVTVIDAPPGGTAFKPVGLFFGHSCGTLDCHGEVGRNFRVYYQYGLRLSPTDQPGGSLTTTDELEATYRSAVALEPEIMSEVVAADGQNAQLLTLVRKPTGLEAHKGGTVIQMGDDQEKCLLSWLASAVDDTSCNLAVRDW